jgi:putative transposase
VSYWRLYYHVVWGTREREGLIDDDRAEVIQRSMRAACHDAGTIVHAIGTMPDHVHLAVSIPPRVAIADFVKQLKGSASHLLNHAAGRPDETFAWQREYGVLSFGERSLPQIVAYVENQVAHHAADDLWPSFELTERPYAPGNGKERGGGSRPNPTPEIPQVET